MSWSSTLALNREENKDSRPVIGLRLTEETLAALRRGDSCTLVFEQGEAFLHVGEAVFRLDRRTLAVDREVREVYQSGHADSSSLKLLGTQRQMYAVTGRPMSGSLAASTVSKQPQRTARSIESEPIIRRTTPVSQLDPRRNRRQPSAGSSMEALTPQQIAARSANTTARSPARLSASGVKSSTYGVDSPAAQAAALAAVAANQATMAPKRHATPLRTRLLKLLAMGPTDIGALQTKLAQRPEAFTVDLTRLTDRQGSVYYLKPECYQDVQIYEWDYTDEERDIVVALAQQAFDQLGLPENARERIMLLAPDERPAGWDHKGTLKERVIHALALKPMEFKQAQERAGATEDDSFRETLRQVGRFSSNAWILQDASYREVQVDTWPGWSEEERKKVAATMRSVFASTGLSESDPVWDRLSNYPPSPLPPPPPEQPAPSSITTVTTTETSHVATTNDSKASAPPATKSKTTSGSSGRKTNSTIAKISAISKRSSASKAAVAASNDANQKTATPQSNTETPAQETAPVKQKRPRKSKKAAAAAAADTSTAKQLETTEPAIPSPWAAVPAAPATNNAEVAVPTSSKTETSNKRSLLATSITTTETIEATDSPKQSSLNGKLKRTETATPSSSSSSSLTTTTTATSVAGNNGDGGKSSVKRSRLATTTQSSTSAKATPTRQANNDIIATTTIATTATISDAAIATSNNNNTATAAAAAAQPATAPLAVSRTVTNNREVVHTPVKLPEHPPTVSTRADLRQLYRLFKDAHKEHLRLYRRLTIDVQRYEVAEAAYNAATDSATQEKASKELEDLRMRASGSASRRRQARYEFLRTWIQEAKQEANRAVQEYGW